MMPAIEANAPMAPISPSTIWIGRCSLDAARTRRS